MFCDIFREQLKHQPFTIIYISRFKVLNTRIASELNSRTGGETLVPCDLIIKHQKNNNMEAEQILLRWKVLESDPAEPSIISAVGGK